MRALCALVAGLLLFPASEWHPDGWLKALHEVAIAREHRPVRLARVSDRDARWQAIRDYGFRAVLRDPVVRARVFAPGSIGYTFIPPRPKPVVVFVNGDRVEPALLRLVAAHELGHVLLHSRGFLQIVALPGDQAEPLLADSFNAVQDVLLERELLAQRVNSQPLLTRQLRVLASALAHGGPVGAVPDTGHLNASHLATMATPLLVAVKGEEAEKQRLRHMLSPEAARLISRYSAILARPINDAAGYREAIYQACEANGVRRERVRFAPD
jgi:hypothetical protein